MKNAKVIRQYFIGRLRNEDLKAISLNSHSLRLYNGHKRNNVFD